MSIRGTLPHMLLSPCADKEWETLTYVMLTSNKYWDPTCLDCKEQLDNEEQFDAQSSLPNELDSKLFNEHGDHRKKPYNHELNFFDAETHKEETIDDLRDSFLSHNIVSTKRKDPGHRLV